MNILEEIVAYKKLKVGRRKAALRYSDLEKSVFFQRQHLSMKKFLMDESKTGIIAEFKRRSPSKGIINAFAEIAEVTKAYTQHGASCLSVLTDEKYFGGSDEDLKKVRVNEIPILRKDFIIDEYQIIEAKSIGADAILLIAACLSAKEVNRFAALAKNTGMDVLLELHSEEELEHICDTTEFIGINNRNLKTFEVDIERSLSMAKQIPESKIKIAESGIGTVEDILLFRRNGYKGFLIGENFMKDKDPGETFKKFTEQLNKKNEY